MTERWPSMYGPGLDWVERTEAAIVALDHPEQRAMLAITNAIEYQFDIGACAETIGHLLAAMIAQATSIGIPLRSWPSNIRQTQCARASGPRAVRPGKQLPFF